MHALGSTLTSTDLRSAGRARGACACLMPAAWARQATGRAATAWRLAMLSLVPATANGGGHINLLGTQSHAVIELIMRSTPAKATLA